MAVKEAVNHVITLCNRDGSVRAALANQELKTLRYGVNAEASIFISRHQKKYATSYFVQCSHG